MGPRGQRECPAAAITNEQMPVASEDRGTSSHRSGGQSPTKLVGWVPTGGSECESVPGLWRHLLLGLQTHRPVLASAITWPSPHRPCIYASRDMGFRAHANSRRPGGPTLNHVHEDA